MKSRIGFFLTGLLLVPFALLVGGRLPYFLLYCYLAALVLPLLHGLLGRLFLKVTLLLPEKELMAGEEISLQYQISNPLWISFPRIEFHNQLATRLTGKTEPPVQLQLASRDLYRDEVKITCNRRGIYRTGQVYLVMGDIFQLFSFKKRVTVPLTLKIYPRLVPLRQAGVEASQYLGDLAANDPLFQDPAALSYLRAYREGDSFKKIHWKASAKGKDWMVKVFEERGDNQVAVIIDSNRPSYREDSEGWLEDRLVETALSLVDECFQAGIRASLHYQEAGEDRQLQGSGKNEIKGFLEALVGFHPQGEASFDRQIEGILNKVQPGSTLFLLTPRVDKALGALGIRLKRKGFRPVFFMAHAVGVKVTEGPEKQVAGYLKQEGIPFHQLPVSTEQAG